MTALLNGLGIGFAIAAPVGPIGMLCMRRTLQAGGTSGLATGLGAAVADASYGVVVASGLSLTGWLVSHSTQLTLVGSALLVWLGVRAARASLARGRARTESASPASHATSRGAAFASTFALTATNPTTILGFIGVITALGPSAAGSGAAFLLVLGVFLGSMLWWALLVTLVCGVREIVSATWLGWIDLATGLVLIASGLVIGVRVAL